MGVDDWKFIAEQFGAFSMGAVFAGAIIYFFMKSYVFSYLTEKGKNLATKEDIEEITRKVEEVKAELQARHTLRFAALDKRLQAHQDAFKHVVSLAQVFFSEKKYISMALDTCITWYSENALFLDPKAKTAFDAAFTAARQQSWPRGKESDKLPGEYENYQTVLGALTAITEAAGLPPLNEEIAKALPSSAEEVRRGAQ